MQTQRDNQQEGNDEDDGLGEGTTPSRGAASSRASPPNRGLKRAASQRSFAGSQSRGESRGSSRGGRSSQVPSAKSIVSYMNLLDNVSVCFGRGGSDRKGRRVHKKCLVCGICFQLEYGQHKNRDKLSVERAIPCCSSPALHFSCDAPGIDQASGSQARRKWVTGSSERFDL